MTVTNQIKILEDKIKTNQAQYDLDWLAAKISALPSGELRKYEYLTGEGLGYKPSAVEQAKFDYSPLGKVFTKGSDKDEDKNSGLFKRLKILKIKTKKHQKKLKIKKTKKSAKKDSETNKSKSSLIYSPKHSFYRYRLSEFNKISLIDLKFNKIEECYGKFIALKDVDVEPENIEH